jgi:bifunctional enzyme CysN/CysC
MDVTQLLKDNEEKDLLRFVTAGSVDDGKSTLIGRLLYESKGIFEDQLASIQQRSARAGSAGEDLDLSLVTDGLRAEREQGITIDVAYRYFATPRRKFIIADTPGHEQYTRNTATGASTASLMVILIDAEQGILTQSRRHAFIASLLGIRHLVVAVNKMDLVAYSERVYRQIEREFSEFLTKLEIPDVAFIPVSALKGDNVVHRSRSMEWYQGSTLMNYLETVQVASDRNLIDLRLPVQYVCRPDRTFRGYMGTMAGGVLRPGDDVLILPSGTANRVESVRDHDGECAEVFPPLSVTVTLEKETDVSRGDMIVHPKNMPHVGNTFEAMVVWMAEQPLKLNQRYFIKHATRMVGGQVSALRYRMDVNALHRLDAETLDLNEIGRVSMALAAPIAYDPYSRNHQTGSFIVIDRVTNNTVGAGMILDRSSNELYTEPQQRISQPRSSHVHVQTDSVTRDQRAERLGQKPATVWLTGLVGAGKTTSAYLLERKLFDAGCHAVVLDGENLRLGVNKDLGFESTDRSENIRRAGEIAKLLNSAGQICICALLSPLAEDRQIAREIVGEDRFIEVYLSAPAEVCRQRASELYQQADRGEVERFPGVTAPYQPPDAPELILPTHELPPEACVEKLLALLADRGFIKG